MKTRYTKLADGQVQAEIIILDRQDYPTMDIFDESEIIADRTKFTLIISDRSIVSEVFPNAHEAEKNAVRFIGTIVEALRRWRDTKIPCDMDYEI